MDKGAFSANTKKRNQRKQLIAELSEKYNIKPHCIADNILLYLRYLNDQFQKRILDKPAFEAALMEFYKRYRIMNAEDPTTFSSYRGIYSFSPANMAACLFYIITIMQAELIDSPITQKEITEAIKISNVALHRWRQVAKHFDLLA